jgi:hypothetical protein
MQPVAKAVFFNVPVYGHVNPTLSLVAELVRRGDEITYYSSETSRPAIERAGATFHGVDAFMNEWTPVSENLARITWKWPDDPDESGVSPAERAARRFAPRSGRTTSGGGRDRVAQAHARLMICYTVDGYSLSCWRLVDHLRMQ